MNEPMATVGELVNILLAMEFEMRLFGGRFLANFWARVYIKFCKARDSSHLHERRQSPTSLTSRPDISNSSY